MALKDFFMGKEGGIERTPRFSPQQSEAFQQALTSGLSGLMQQRPSFDPIEQLTRSKFKSETIPSIAERFASMGGQSSSGYLDALDRAGTDLDLGLAAMRTQYDMQGRNELMNLLQLGLSPQEETFYRPGTQGFLGTMGAGLGQGLGMAGGALGASYLGGGNNQIIELLMKLLGNKGQEQGGGGGSITAPNV